MTKALKRWNSDDISSWLVSIGMKPYIRTFKAHNITGRDLCTFDEDDLKTKCKINARPVRKILYKRLKHIQGRFHEDNDERSDEEKADESKTGHAIEKQKKTDEECPLKKKIDNIQDQPVKPIRETIRTIDEIKPKLSPEKASFKIQGLYRCLKARQDVAYLIHRQYRKVYSLQTGRFIYKYVGTINLSSDIRVFSKLIDPTSSISKLINLKGEDIKVSFTIELATMKIQRFARYCISTKKARSLVRENWIRSFDPICGQHFFYFPRLGVSYWEKPKMLRGERWDPSDKTEWTEEDVCLYFRRLGLSKYSLIDDVHRFGINGQLLLALDLHDFLRFQIPERISKQIMNNRSRDVTITPSKKILRRRKVLRIHFHLIESAIIIQKYVRGYLYASRMDTFIKFMKRYNHQKHERIPYWWSDRNLQYMIVAEGLKKRKTYIIEC